MSQLQISIKLINDLLASSHQSEQTWVLADETCTLVDQVVKIWKRKSGLSSYPRQFFDQIVSNQYFGVIWPPCCQSADLLSLTRSPADFILFDQNDLGLPTNQWISRVDCVQQLFSNKIKKSYLPKYYSLKICAPEMTIYQLLTLIDSLVSAETENDVVDRLFFDGLVINKEERLKWNNLNLIKIMTSL